MEDLEHMDFAGEDEFGIFLYHRNLRSGILR